MGVERGQRPRNRIRQDSCGQGIADDVYFGLTDIRNGPDVSYIRLIRLIGQGDESLEDLN